MMRVYWLEARTELLKFVRMKSYSLSTILFPLMFYCFFGLAMPPMEKGGDSLARYLLATYGAFAIMGSTLYAFGVGRGNRRSRGHREEATIPVVRCSAVLALFPPPRINVERARSRPVRSVKTRYR